jgi:hypothetical protein
MKQLETLILKENHMNTRTKMPAKAISKPVVRRTPKPEPKPYKHAAARAGATVHEGVEKGVKFGAHVIAEGAIGLFQFGKGLALGKPKAN